MILVALLYMLLIVSTVHPGLFLVSAPLTVLATTSARRRARQRREQRMIAHLAQLAADAERRHRATLRYFTTGG